MTTFDIFDFLSECKPIENRCSYENKFAPNTIYCLSWGFLDYKPFNEKTYYINTHYVNPSDYLKNIKNQKMEECLKRVKKNGKELKYVLNQNLDICMEAVKQNVYAFEFIKKEFQIYPIFVIIGDKNPNYLNLILNQLNTTMLDLQLEYYQLNNIPNICKDIGLNILSYI